jgi:hypothetical protein
VTTVQHRSKARAGAASTWDTADRRQRVDRSDVGVRTRGYSRAPQHRSRQGRGRRRPGTPPTPVDSVSIAATSAFAREGIQERDDCAAPIKARAGATSTRGTPMPVDSVPIAATPAFAREDIQGRDDCAAPMGATSTRGTAGALSCDGGRPHGRGAATGTNGDKRGQTGTNGDKQGQKRDKRGQTGTNRDKKIIV